MNTIKKALLAAIIALSGLAILTTAHATPVTWTTGDVFLGFENAAGSIDYLVDLGAGSTFAAAVANGTFSAVNLNADLTSVYGNGWATNATTGLQYGLFGIAANRSIAYASVASGNPAPPTKTTGALSTAQTHYNTLGLGYNSDLQNIPAQTWNHGVSQLNGTPPDTGFSTWTGNTPSTTPFATYGVSFENGVSGNLDFYGTTGTTSTLEGALQLTSGGLFELVAVPEPSTYALFGLGVMVVVIGSRRRMIAQKA